MANSAVTTASLGFNDLVSLTEVKMATDKANSYPKMATKNWWALRERFKKSIPSIVDTSYVASTLKMSPDSARSNVLAPLRLVGLIDDKGKPTDLANKWRNDSQYPEVCETIIKNVYPQSLVDAFPDPQEDISGTEAWFMHEARVGEPAAKMYTSFYGLLCEADITKAAEAMRSNNSTKSTKLAASKRPNEVSASKNAKKPEKQNPAEQQKKIVDYNLFPNLHIDIQIHISPETTTEQIDKIFASMAKHLSGLPTPSTGAEQ